MSKTMQRTYPQGVTSWIDLKQPDTTAAIEFYGPLFGWTFQDVRPAGAPGSYLIAILNGADVAAIGAGETMTWDTYISVNDIEMMTENARAAGGTVLQSPTLAGSGGSSAVITDPNGARFCLWQADQRKGAQISNAPGTWNFSNLHSHDPHRALDFYSAIFDWKPLGDDVALGVMLRVLGYGDHLESTVDPDIRKRQEFAPEGFEDVIGGVKKAETNENEHWHVVFSVTDRDASAALVETLGGTVVATSQNKWVYEALVRDPAGAEFSISQFAY